jgi:hypothetical protein
MPGGRLAAGLFVVSGAAFLKFDLLWRIARMCIFGFATAII